MASEEKQEELGGKEMTTDALVYEMAMQDKRPWYTKKNLRLLYLFFFPTCIGVEMTSG